MSYKKKIEKIKEFYASLAASEWRVFSQNGEDGVILELFRRLEKVTKIGKKYVEIGTENGNQCNSRLIRTKYNWTGHMFDGGNENPSINLHKEIILHSNILDLFAKYKIENEDLDLLSEDTDYADYWIVEKILSKYRPYIRR